MGIVAFIGIGYDFMFDTVYGAYPSWLDVYIIFASGVGLGVCTVDENPSRKGGVFS